MDEITFLSQFWKSPRSIGAVVPSSSGLSRTMLGHIDFDNLHAIVEFGPGTGAFTKDIARKLRPGQRYIGIEINRTFCAQLVERFPGLHFVNDSVVRLEGILADAGIGEIDAVVCGLPWASLPISDQARIMDAMLRRLPPGGVFVSFAYPSALALPGAQALRRRLKASFSRVTTTRIVWWNFPPAFAYVCVR
ncbi:MAG TPA: methyltransferase [Stellaceae bacterium]|nr:methyltransferase [Stellaceae bacterium]